MFGSGTRKVLPAYTAVGLQFHDKNKHVDLINSLVDPYENIYTVIRGMKQFVLFPPTEGWYMNGQCLDMLV